MISYKQLNLKTMKNIISVFLIFIGLTCFAQQNNYEQAMQNALEKLNQASTMSEFTDAANIFERIAQTETKEWLPLYHAAHAFTIMGFTEPDVLKKDPYFDKAHQLLDRALVIAPDESELYTLLAFVYPGKITVDPMIRGPRLIGKLNEALDKSISLNPENPRNYYLRAVMLLNTPETFGGGKAVAKPIFETAQQKFDQFEPQSTLWPNWGKELNEAELSKL
jgi:tetratricopeptide (TPR) repeat protein